MWPHANIYSKTEETMQLLSPSKIEVEMENKNEVYFLDIFFKII